MNVRFWIEGEEFRLGLEEGRGGVFRVALNGRTHDVSAEFLNRDEVLLNVDGRVFNVTVSGGRDGDAVFVNGRVFRVDKKAPATSSGQDRGRTRKREVSVSMPGRVVQVLAEEGGEVSEGQPVMILEAMKMQNEIKAPRSGTLRRLGARSGETVEAGAVLFIVE